MTEFILSILAVILLFALIWLVKLVWFRPFNIDHFFQKIMFQFVLRSPELLSSLRILEGVGIRFHNKKLTNISDSYTQRTNAQVKRNLNILNSYNPDKFDSDQRLSYEIMKHFLKTAVDDEGFQYHDYPVNQLFGVQNELPTFMASMHQINDQKDAEHYVLRLSKFKEKFDQLLEVLKIREERGTIPPAFVINKVLEEMKNFVGSDAKSNFLYVSMAEKLEKISKLREAQKLQLLASAEQEINKSVFPAYKKLIDYFEYLKTKADTHDGVWKLPKGDEYYAYLLRRYTTTDLKPEEVHQLGLSEVLRIQKQIEVILSELGHTGKPLADLIKDINQIESLRYPDTEEAREQALRDYQAIIDGVSLKLENLFDLKPKSKVVVERIPKFKEKTAPGAYYMRPAADGSRPGVFYANLLNLPYKHDMQTLAYHEAIPGHHFQLAIQQELKGLPLFRKFIPFTAYAEGWALYAEKLALENNLYNDLYSVVGYLKSELFRSVRLVVDTGIHYKKWTREQAIEYMAQNTGMDMDEIVPEIERYIVMPGQACSYKIGELEILRLRKMAQNQLGTDFDIRKFHNAVLKNGSVPLKILEDIIEDYIKSEKLEKAHA